jgi:hypothetical protein
VHVVAAPAEPVLHTHSPPMTAHPQPAQWHWPDEGHRGSAQQNAVPSSAGPHGVAFEQPEEHSRQPHDLTDVVPASTTSGVEQLTPPPSEPPSPPLDPELLPLPEPLPEPELPPLELPLPPPELLPDPGQPVHAP